MMSATSVKAAESKPPGGQRGGADAQARGGHRRARVKGHRVAVHGNADFVQQVLGLLAIKLRVTQVHFKSMSLSHA